MVDIIELSQDLALAAQSGTDKSTLVAGQALAFWGAYYLDDQTAADYQAALASRDIDFLERRINRIAVYIEQMKEVANNYGATLTPPQYPSLDDATFQTAILQLEAPTLDQPIIIDFLNHIDGIEDSEVEAGTDYLQMDGKELPILNPCLCLKARIHNLLRLYPRLGKSTDKLEVEAMRVRAGIDIVRLYLIDVARSKGFKAASQRANTITNIAKKSLGKDLFRRYGINILDCLEGVGFDERYMQKTVADLRRKIE